MIYVTSPKDAEDVTAWAGFWIDRLNEEKAMLPDRTQLLAVMGFLIAADEVAEQLEDDTDGQEMQAPQGQG